MDNMQDNGFDNSSVTSGASIVDQMMSGEQPVIATMNQVNSGNAIPEGQVQQQMEIDPRFANLDPQTAMLRTFQSRYDQAQEELKSLKAYQEKAKVIEDVLIQISEDDEALEAFLHQRKPELVKKPDFTSWVTNKLKSEFGEDFEFDGSKASYDPIHIAYSERTKELYKEYQTGNQNKVKSLGELTQRRKAEREAQENERRQALMSFKEQNKMSDEQFKGFVNFLQKANGDVSLLYNLYRVATKQTSIPNANSFMPPNSLNNVDNVLRNYGF